MLKYTRGTAPIMQTNGCCIQKMGHGLSCLLILIDPFSLFNLWGFIIHSQFRHAAQLHGAPFSNADKPESGIRILTIEIEPHPYFLY